MSTTAPTAADYLTPAPHSGLATAADFYAKLLEYIWGGPESKPSESRGRYEGWWQDHAGKRSNWFREDLL